MKKLLLSTAFLGWFGVALAQQPIVFPAPSAPQALSLSAGTSGTNTTLTAVLSGNVRTFDYICGFVATSAGTSAVTVANITVTGITTPLTFTYDYPNPGQGILGIAFPGCISSTSKGQGITVTMGPGDTLSQESLSAWGYAN